MTEVYRKAFHYGKQNEMWRCPIHGELGSPVYEFKILDYTMGPYCFACFHDWLAVNKDKIAKEKEQPKEVQV